jgi:hypothetical protein
MVNHKHLRGSLLSAAVVGALVATAGTAHAAGGKSSSSDRSTSKSHKAKAHNKNKLSLTINTQGPESDTLTQPHGTGLAPGTGMVLGLNSAQETGLTELKPWTMTNPQGAIAAYHVLSGLDAASATTMAQWAPTPSPTRTPTSLSTHQVSLFDSRPAYLGAQLWSADQIRKHFGSDKAQNTPLTWTTGLGEAESTVASQEPGSVGFLVVQSGFRKAFSVPRGQFQAERQVVFITANRGGKAVFWNPRTGNIVDPSDLNGSVSSHSPMPPSAGVKTENFNFGFDTKNLTPDQNLRFTYIPTDAAVNP